MNLKKLMVVLLGASLIINSGGCSKPAVKHLAKNVDESDQTTSEQDDSKIKELDQDETAGIGDPVVIEPDENRELTDGEKELLADMRRNAADLQEFLVANPIASPVENEKCYFKDDDNLVYTWSSRPLKAEINHCIGDPFVGDQRNCIYVRETESGQVEQLNLNHLKRDHTLISYQLEAGKHYELLIYVHNDAKYDEKYEDTVGSVYALGATIALPKDVKLDSMFSMVFSGQQGPDEDAPDIVTTSSRAAFTCEQPVTLHWDTEIRCYDITGKYASSKSLDSESNRGARIWSADDEFFLELGMLDKLPSEFACFFRFEFYTDPEQKEPSLPYSIDLRKKK